LKSTGLAQLAGRWNDGRMKKKSPRLMPLNHFIAETLEEEADKIPSSHAAMADNLREAASHYRAQPSGRLVRVHEVTEDASQAAARIVREATERA
jgi:hypothetical protein